MALSEAQEQVLRMRSAGMTRRKIAEDLGISLDAVRDRLRRAKQWETVTPGQASAMEVSGLDVTNARHGWRVVQHKDGSRDSVFWKAEEGEEENSFLEAVREALAEYEGAGSVIAEPAYVDAELATVFPLPDLHFGLYAFGRETGEDYDLSIADNTNRKAFTRLMAATPSSEAAVILGLGDLLHADDTSNKTAKSGHALDVDTRHSKVLKTAIQFMIFATELALTRHRHVTVRNLPGNHDLHSAVAVTMALWAWFRDNPRVTVDDSPSYFWWWRWGTVLLGATHGDMAKPANMPLVMAASRPEDWGQTKHRLVLTGHIHTRTALEVGGVIVESFQSTAARDAWHEASGYRAGRSLSAITFHNLDGEIARQKVNIV